MTRTVALSKAVPAFVGAVPLLAAAFAVLAVVAPTLTAQTAQVEEVRITPDTIELGDRFELSFNLTVPGGYLAFFPDSIDAGGFESFAPVEWSPRDAAGSVSLTVRYPLIAFQTGSLAIEGIDVFVAPAAEGVSSGTSEPGDVVGSWDAFRAEPAALPSVRPLPVPEQRVEVATVLALDDETTQITPRPAADVSGANRNWSATLLSVLFGLLLTSVVAVSARDLMRDTTPPPPPPSAREQALAALDDILASGMHADGRIREFYGAWSDVVRRYVEGFSEPLGPAWTTTELLADLQGPLRSEAIARALDADAIADPMRSAERVKFGGLRPDSAAAEADLRTARVWIAGARDHEA